MKVFLIDADNLSSPAWIEEAFQQLETGGQSLAVRRAYGSADNLRGLEPVLRARAIVSLLNIALTKNTTDVALAVDAMALSWQVPMPTTVIIGSGDADFVPMVARLRERGIRMVCVSGPGKMSQEAAPWYDEVIEVGLQRGSLAHEVAIQKVLQKIVEPTNASLPKSTPIKAAAKKVALKEALPQKTSAPAKKKTVTANAPVTYQQILAAIPALKTGQAMALGEVVKILHDAKLLAKNTASTKLFSKYPGHFELLPSRQPNRVRYTLPP